MRCVFSNQFGRKTVGISLIGFTQARGVFHLCLALLKCGGVSHTLVWKFTLNWGQIFSRGERILGAKDLEGDNLNPLGSFVGPTRPCKKWGLVSGQTGIFLGENRGVDTPFTLSGGVLKNTPRGPHGECCLFSHIRGSHTLFFLVTL